MLFIGYLYGIRSEIRLLKEIEVNVAYRWFIGYDLIEKLRRGKLRQLLSPIFDRYSFMICAILDSLRPITISVSFIFVRQGPVPTVGFFDRFNR